MVHRPDGTKPHQAHSRLLPLLLASSLPAALLWLWLRVGAGACSTLALYGTYRLAQRMRPGGDKMVAFTRILHRTTDDALSPCVPTFRADPLHPGCDGGVPGRSGRCRYVVADRPGAVRQFFQAAQLDPTLIKGAWAYLIETDFLFVKPVLAPGPAESSVRSLGFWYSYVYADAKVFKSFMPRFYPPGLGPLSEVPRTGPSPVMARVAEWLRVLPRWEAYSAQIEADAEASKRLGWVREMYAFSLAVAVERLDLDLGQSGNSTLIIQPPVDLRLGRATQIHYTWGPKLKEGGNDTEFWRFEKRDWTQQRFEDTAPPVPLPPPWHPGWRTPSARVGRKGAPTSQEDYELILLEVNTFNRGLEEVGGSQWREVLGREAAAAAAVARKKRGGG
ncbi:hypothetical protein CHLNCDRAFT_143799 [Chlorella variabilis]|uniref:Hydroxyproline O-arabinosyltransferase-like domain-containing protein n=1 Tax=Chlorella variabilis TaxID=554065 RepID=E1ZAG7_CHLVA|nr:hypothetical protein CHLNCDRAFT_143799 [Chlorella variabilis]EFN57057.1 hypothetical protein CHLNCDRAFT_143799 [Chlorella variabilis]|eukprot:XP_005849159.1 hypothetical protein CHLNCDRAFT_143799 [Chlorella variabilis]